MDFSRRFDMAAGAFIFLVFLTTVYLTKDFLTTILLSIFLVFLLKPLYAVFFRLTRQRQISSLFSILIVFVLILAILLGITGVLLVEISNLEKSGALSSAQFTSLTQEIDIWAKSALPAWVHSYVSDIVLKYVQEISDIPVTIATWAFPIVQRELSSFASELPVLFAQLVVVVFFTYYILIDGKEIVGKTVDLFPRQRRWLVKNFLQELNSIYTTLFTVYFSTSMLSGVLAAIGFSILGVPYPFVLGAVVGIFTFVPMLGPAVVFIPLALYYLFMGDMIRFLTILVFGTVALMVIPENVIRPHLAMKSARIHPIVTLLAYTAPIFVVGIIGVIIGPTLYGFLLAAYRAVINNRES
ncbi:MAG: AI-2E family transporter [Methanotrichaceae archaeon]|nr:AI-2E family transporter [Methanotrichaceae archaeon]